MAIKKIIELENGVTAEYIRIKGVQKSYDVDRGEESILNIEVYLDGASRNDEKKPVILENVNVPLVNSFEEAYVELKKLDKYIDAEDII